MSLGPLMIGIKGLVLDAAEREQLRHPSVGGVILFSRNYQSIEQLQALVADIHGLRQPPLLVAVDHEGGRVQRFREGFTRLPAVRELGKRYDTDPAAALRQAYQWGWLMAAELRAVGVDFSFAPVLDIDKGLSKIIGDRAFHESVDAIGHLAFHYVKGMQTAGMPAVGKHFPGHGAVAPDSHNECVVDQRPYEHIASDDIKPFQHLVDCGIPALMMAHIIYRHVDALPASLSALWIKRILRQRLGFQGVVFSDDLCMEGCKIAGDMLQRSRRALDAGNDMILICNDFDAIADTIERLEVSPDPVATSRLARMHGRAAVSIKALYASAEWRDAVHALDGDLPPPLQLS